MFLCYGGSKYTAEQLRLASSLLQVSALTIILFTLVQVTSGILQGAGRQKIPMYTLLAGVICKVTLNYFLVRVPSIGIAGAPIASIVCYTVSLVPNLIATCKITRMRFDFKEIIAKPLISALVMGAAVFLVWHFVFGGVPSGSGFISRLIPVVVCIVTGMATFFGTALAIGAFSPDVLPRRWRRG